MKSSLFYQRLGQSLTAPLLMAVLTVSAPANAQVSVLTNKYDNNRDGQNPNETLLTTANVNVNSFGKIASFPVDGYILSQPLVISGLAISGGTHNVVFATTLNNSVYAIDGDSSTQYWKVNLGTAFPQSVEGCNLTGFNQVGIVSTPVIDASTNTIYITDKTYTGGVGAYWLHALDVTTGAEKFGGPAQINGTASGLTFIPQSELQRMSLLLSNGTIYIGFGSNGCDFTGRGWFFAYSASTLQQQAAMTMQPDKTYGSALWQAGVGPAADSAGNVYLSTGNGYFDYGAGDLGDSILKLSLGAGGLTIVDSFTPYDQANMAANDKDLGSAGPVILPAQTGTYPDMLVASGKDADIYMIDRDSMGGYNPTDNSQIPQYVPTALGGEMHGAPLYWNNTIFFLAEQDYLRAYSLSNGVISTTPVAQSTVKLTTTGGDAVTGNGSSNGIVWLSRTVQNVPLFSAYDAQHLILLYDSGMAPNGRDTVGVVPHFAVPTVANGKAFVGTQAALLTYGLLPALSSTAGNGQTGSAGTTLPVTLTVTLANPYSGVPIAGVPVTFSDNKAGGSFSSASGTTNASGQVSTNYTLSAKPKSITISASSTGYGSATFSEISQVGPVATISAISGAKQIGTVGTTLPNPIVVSAKDALGNLEVGVPISFSDGGFGVFNPPGAVSTGANGQASVTYTFGTKAQAITITAANGSASARITETAKAGNAALVNNIQGNSQTAHRNNRLAKALIVSVTDQYGNPLSGLTVNFTDNGAGGTFSNAAPVTNAVGQVSVSYTTGSTSGTVTIDASYGTLAPAVFTETVI